VLAFVFLMTGIFASDYYKDYNFCTSISNNTLNICSDFTSNADKVSQIVDLYSAKDLNLLDYVTCVDSEKSKQNFDYRSIRNMCYQTYSLKGQASFKTKCFSDVNNNVLTVQCKGIMPTSDYEWDVLLNQDFNTKVIKVEPKIILSKEFSLGETKFSLFSKQFNLSPLGIGYSDSNIEILPLSIEVKDVQDPLDAIFRNKQTKTIALDQLQRADLDCITIKILLSESKLGKYYVKKSGYSVLLSADQIISSCEDDVSYTFAIDLTQYETKKKLFLDMLDLLINNYLNDNNFSALNMNSQLNGMIKEYDKFSSSEKDIQNKKDVVLKLSLDIDPFLNLLQKSTQKLSNEEKKNVLASAGPTILKNKEDSISIRRKNTVSAILDFFEKDKNSITDSSIMEIYYDIEYSLLKKHYEDVNLLNLTDVSCILSSSSIKIDSFAFDFIKPAYVEADKNFLIESDGNVTRIVFLDYNIQTPLSLSLKNNKIFVSNKEIVFLNADTFKKISPNMQIMKVELVLEDEFPVYVVKGEVFGKLLGLFKIKELIESKYFATTGILSDVTKPWWDFLVVYT